MATSPVPIRGKVARILDSRQLVFSIGERDGVAVGMFFDVLDPKGEDIKDPDSGEVLGSVDRQKVRVKVVRVQERISIATTFRTKKVNVGGEGPSLDFGLAKYLMPPVWVMTHETLKTSEKTLQDLDEVDSYVKTGDPIVQVLEAVDEEPEALAG